MKKIKGIIFDFNGTLFWDTPKHEEAWLKYAKDILGLDISKEEYYANIHGSTNRLIYEYLYKKPIPQEIADTFGMEKEEYYRDLCYKEKDNLTLGKGAAELLDYLVKNNIPHAIATSSEISNVRFYKEIFPLEKWFDDEHIIYDDGTVKGKPEPDIYLKSGAKLGIQMKDLAVVEDALNGVRSAKSAGAGLVIGIAPDGKEKFLGKEYTDIIIEDFLSFPKEIFEK